MSKLVGHVVIELVKNDAKNPKHLTIQADDFAMEQGGVSVVKDGETSTWYLFRHIGADFSYELKSEFLKKDFKSVLILEDELDFGK